MTQTANTTESRKGKHLDRSHQTINTEIKDGTVRQIKRQIQNGKAYDYEYFSYSAAAGQTAYEKARESSRKKPKWVDAPDFMAYADQQMKQEKRSPDVVVHHAKKNNLFPHESIPCPTTLSIQLYRRLFDGDPKYRSLSQNTQKYEGLSQSQEQNDFR
ncbi:hypothetical protein IGJ89_001187 [Enterococcus sp. AZ096]